MPEMLSLKIYFRVEKKKIINGQERENSSQLSIHRRSINTVYSTETGRKNYTAKHHRMKVVSSLFGRRRFAITSHCALALLKVFLLVSRITRSFLMPSPLMMLNDRKHT